MRWCALAVVLLLSGCASLFAPPMLPVWTAIAGAAAGAERLDDDIFNAWARSKGLTAVPTAVANPVGTCVLPSGVHP